MARAQICPPHQFQSGVCLVCRGGRCIAKTKSGSQCLRTVVVDFSIYSATDLPTLLPDRCGIHVWPGRGMGEAAL